MTYKEKVEIIKEFHSNLNEVSPALVFAVGDTEKAESAILKIIEVYKPVIDMYTEELNTATNPTSGKTVPIVIMLLRQMAEGLTKQNPAAAEIADTLNKIFPCKVLSVRSAHAVRRNE